MTNPYDPPVAEITQPVEVRRRSFYTGGYGLVAVLAISVGGVVGFVINFFIDKNSPYVLWGAPALGWLLALVFLISIMRFSRFSVGGGVLLAMGLAIPAYVIYVPVCSFTAMLTETLVPGVNYGPTSSVIVLGSAFAFLVILLAIAGILRICCRVPISSATRTPGQANDQPPENDFL